MSNVKREFMVFIRSTGERTEGLCREACEAEAGRGRVVVLRDYYPAARVYEEMFAKAIENQYEWFLGVDADVVLKPGWYKDAVAQKKNMADRNWLVFGFAVKDAWLGEVDRGNHFYNGKYAREALDILKKKTSRRLKPESDICRMLPYDNPFIKERVVGYHAYEQYYRDIFYTFWMRARRDNKNLKSLADLKSGVAMDDEVARVGIRAGKQPAVVWYFKKIFKIDSILAAATPEYREKLLGRYFPEIVEKRLLTLNLSDFYYQVQYAKR
jgi:hypothetical protein